MGFFADVALDGAVLKEHRLPHCVSFFEAVSELPLQAVIVHQGFITPPNMEFSAPLLLQRCPHRLFASFKVIPRLLLFLSVGLASFVVALIPSDPLGVHFACVAIFGFGGWGGRDGCVS